MCTARCVIHSTKVHVMSQSSGQLRRRLDVFLAAACASLVLAGTSGCISYVAYCMAYSGAICRAGQDPEWGGGTHILDGSYGFDTHFRVQGTATWQAHPSAVVVETGSGFLVMKNDQTDYKVVIDYEANEHVDATLFLRASNPNAINAKTGYRITMASTNHDDPPGSMAGLERGPIKATSSRLDSTRRLEVVAKGPRLKVSLNGRIVADVVDHAFATGRLAIYAAPKPNLGRLSLQSIRLRATHKDD